MFKNDLRRESRSSTTFTSSIDLLLYKMIHLTNTILVVAFLDMIYKMIHLTITILWIWETGQNNRCSRIELKSRRCLCFFLLPLLTGLSRSVPPSALAVTPSLLFD